MSLHIFNRAGLAFQISFYTLKLKYLTEGRIKRHIFNGLNTLKAFKDVRWLSCSHNSTFCCVVGSLTVLIDSTPTTRLVSDGVTHYRIASSDRWLGNGEVIGCSWYVAASARYLACWVPELLDRVSEQFTHPSGTTRSGLKSCRVNSAYEMVKQVKYWKDLGNCKKKKKKATLVIWHVWHFHVIRQWSPWLIGQVDILKVGGVRPTPAEWRCTGKKRHNWMGMFTYQLPKNYLNISTFKLARHVKDYCAVCKLQCVDTLFFSVWFDWFTLFCTCICFNIKIVFVVSALGLASCTKWRHTDILTVSSSLSLSLSFSFFSSFTLYMKPDCPSLEVMKPLYQRPAPPPACRPPPSSSVKGQYNSVVVEEGCTA